MLINESYIEVRDMMAKLSDAEVAPLATQIDHEGLIPDSLRQKLNENGLMGIYVPEEYGGAGMDYMSYAIMIEEISRSCGSTGVLLSAHNSLAVWPILKYGTEEQKKKYLPKMASGEWVGCFCLSEPNAGSDPGTLATFAEDKGDSLKSPELKTSSLMEKKLVSPLFWPKPPKLITIKELRLLLSKLHGRVLMYKNLKIN